MLMRQLLFVSAAACLAVHHPAYGWGTGTAAGATQRSDLLQRLRSAEPPAPARATACPRADCLQLCTSVAALLLCEDGWGVVGSVS